MFVKAYQTRRVPVEDRAPCATLFPVAHQGHRNQAREVGGLVRLLLRRLDAAIFGNPRCVDHIDILDPTSQCALDGRDRDRLQRQVRHLPGKLHVDPVHAALRQLAEDHAQALCQAQIRHEPRKQLLRHRWHVHRVADHAMEQEVTYLFSDRDRDAILCLLGRSAEVRCADNAVRLEQWVISGRLLYEHVQSSPGNLAGLDCCAKRIFVDNPTSGTVQHVHAILHHGERFFVKQALRLWHQWRMDGDEIRSTEQLFKLDKFDPDLPGLLGRDKRILPQHLHLEALRALRHGPANPAEPNDTQHLVVEFRPHERALLPLPLFCRGARLRDPTGHRHHHRKRMLGRRDRVGFWRVHHHDSPLRRRLHVDIVHTHACPPDHLQVVSTSDDVRGHFRLAAHDKGIVLANHLGEPLWRKSSVHNHLDAGSAFEYINALLGQFVANEDLHSVDTPSHSGVIRCQPL